MIKNIIDFSKTKYDSFKLLEYGIIIDDLYKDINKWYNTLYTIYEEYEYCKDINRREVLKEQIKAMGWKNTNIDLKLENIYKSIKPQPVHNIIEYTISENTTSLYIILSYNTYSESNDTSYVYNKIGVSLNINANKIFTINNKKEFIIENISDYYENDNMISIYKIDLVKKDFDKILYRIDELLLNNKYKYGLLNVVDILLNKSMERQHNIICSQFIDSLLKYIGLCINDNENTNICITMNTNNIYKVYEGEAIKYNPDEYTNILKEDVSVLLEKEFPVVVNSDDIIIKLPKKFDINIEYNRIVKLLKNYENTKNINGIKNELCRLWYINIELENKIYSDISKPEKIKYYKTRSLVLNTFNKYLKLIQDYDKDFNFILYFNNSIYSDSSIKINTQTLNNGLKFAKNMVKIFL